MPGYQRLSGLDASFLYLETTSQPLHVCSILELDTASIPGGYTYEALLRTLGQMVCHDRGRNDAGISREVIVVDNASKDGSPEAVRENFPDVQLVALPSNEAIQGFNIGAARARGVAWMSSPRSARTP